MRKNGYSAALREFEFNLGRSRRLGIIEFRLFSDPPQSKDVSSVEALRGGAVVLMVASLERYLGESLAEYVDLISLEAGTTRNLKLPTEFVNHNDLAYINWVIKSSRSSKIDKIIEIRRGATTISSAGFIPESFNRTKANPGPSVVKDLVSEFGVKDPFSEITRNFLRHHKKPLSTRYVETILKNIVAQRNEIAHKGYALGISRKDIKDWSKFMLLLGRSIDNTLRDQSRMLIAAL